MDRRLTARTVFCDAVVLPGRDMSVRTGLGCTVEYHWRTEFELAMIPWHRQILSLVYGIGVTLIALWAIDQGSTPWTIFGTVGMSMLTLVLIFGVEIDNIRVGDKLEIEFTDTRRDSDATDTGTDSDT